MHGKTSIFSPSLGHLVTTGLPKTNHQQEEHTLPEIPTYTKLPIQNPSDS